jgi:WS/DGAT/MGAT family acyltransferase
MSGADAMMLYLDRAEAYNHTIKISIIDPSADPDGWSWKRFKATWATRVSLMPRLRQRYLRVPMGLNHPVWVDDPDFDIDYHLLRVGCPAPGSMVELCELVCEFYAHQMDHSRPLWQVWAVEGLEGGRVAVILFIHHAMTDGVGILRMLDQFWNTRPEAEVLPSPAAWHPAPLPGKGRLLWEGLRDLPGVFAANLPGAIRGTRAGRRILRQWRDQGRTLPPFPGDAKYPAPYAVRLSPHRTFGIRSFSLPRIRALAKKHGVTINDVFIATTSGAIRDLLIEQVGTAPTAPMVATVPFALVPLAERERDGNFSTVCYTLLHTEIADPGERLRACKRDADTMKAYFEATREASIAALMNLLPPAVPKIVARVNEMKGGGLLPFWNVVLSNVPGPRAPLKLGNLRLAEWYSIGQLAHGSTLNVTVWSYVDQFNLSVLADPAVLPDAWQLVNHFESSIKALESAGAGAGNAG